MSIQSSIIAELNEKWAREALEEIKKGRPEHSNIVLGAQKMFDKLKEKGVFSE